MIDKIKNWILQSKIPKKKPSKATGINEFKHIAIFYDATAESEREVIRKWSKNLNNRAITTLGFYNQNTALGDGAFPTYCLKDMNWYNLPSGSQIDAFIGKQYDLVIFASPRILPHMAYIMAQVKAKIIAGPELKNNLDFFDLIIEASTDKTIINTNSIIKDVISAINKIAA